MFINKSDRKYVLIRAFRIVHLWYSSDEWIGIFDDIASRTRSIRLCKYIFECFRGTVFGRIMITGFGLLSAFRIYVPRKSKDEIYALYVYSNEERAIKRLNDFLTSPLVTSRKSLSNLIYTIIDIQLVISTCVLVFRYQSLLKYLSRKGHFVTLCQLTSLVFCYNSLRHQLKKRSPTAVVISSNSLPETLALEWAARSLSIPSIYASHASVAPGGKGQVPTADLVFLDGQSSVDACIDIRDIQFEYLLWGVAGKSAPIKIDRVNFEDSTVGLFLSAPVNLHGIVKSIKYIEDHLKPKRIIVRPHPVAMLTPDLSFLKKAHPSVEIVWGSSLSDCIDQCSLIFSGNSSVHREILRAGIPTIYIGDTDYIEYDYWGFISNKVVFEIDITKPFDVHEMQQFYSNNWADRFRYYDGSYLEDPLLHQQRIQSALSAFLGKTV